MINTASIDVVKSARFGEQWVKPVYDTYGFAHLPRVVQALLTDDRSVPLPFDVHATLREQYDSVVLFFIDAFGWRFFEQYADKHPLLARYVRDGSVSQLTSQFPSTTAAHVTTIHTGLPVGESGVYEWYYYEPRLDAMIAPLLFSYAGDTERDGLHSSGIRAAELFPRRTLYHQLAEHAVRSYVIMDKEYAFSPYSTTLTDGATTVPYRTLPEALSTLADLIQHQHQRSYYFLYYDRIDTVSHMYGPDSPQVNVEVIILLDTLERLLHAALEKHGQRTLFMMTADHGQTRIDPRTTVYLNQTIPQIGSWLRTNRQGKPLVPAGSGRDFFLHIKDEHVEHAPGVLREHLQGRAEVFVVEDLIRQGFFGTTTPSAAFRSRVGNLVVCSYRGESVWWLEPGRFEQRSLGSHGGLTRDEMETVLYAYSY